MWNCVHGYIYAKIKSMAVGQGPISLAMAGPALGDCFSKGSSHTLSGHAQ